MGFQDKLFELAKRLLLGTSQGNIKWTETADEDSFRAVLHTGLVRIERVPARSFRNGANPMPQAPAYPVPQLPQAPAYPVPQLPQAPAFPIPPSPGSDPPRPTIEEFENLGSAAWSSPSDDFEYQLLVLDERNKEIGRYLPDQPEPRTTLRNLWSLANRSARNADQKIDSLLQEVAAKVGKR